MFDHETTAADVLTDAALGAIAGVAATAAMGPVTSYLSKRQPEPAKRREKKVNERLGAPPTVKVAQKAVSTLGKSLPPTATPWPATWSTTASARSGAPPSEPCPRAGSRCRPGQASPWASSSG